ncbi:unnamed protein product, partial [Allacma fusca]
FNKSSLKSKPQETFTVNTSVQEYVDVPDISDVNEKDLTNEQVAQTANKICRTNWLNELSLKRKALQNANNSPEKRFRNSEDPEEFGTKDNQSSLSPHQNVSGIRVTFIKDYKIKCRQSKEAFDYSGHKFSVNNGEVNYNAEVGILATCKFCNRNYTYQNPSMGGTSNLIRHLKKCHGMEYDSIQKNIGSEVVPQNAIMSSWLGSSMHKNMYCLSDPTQKRFNASLQYCIARDKLPLNIVNGEGFKKLIRTLDARIDIPSRSTVERRLRKDFETKVIPGLKKLLNTVDKGIISWDGWKSRRKDSILGFKFHFIDSNWKLRKKTIAIKTLNEGQTGDDIKKCYDAVIEDLGLRGKIENIITDSGANMIKAFRTPQPVVNTEINTTTAEDHDSSSEEDSAVNEPSSMTEDIILYCETDSEDEQTNAEIDVESSSNLADKLAEVFDKTDGHLRCTAHQLQLAINKALEDRDAETFLVYINSVIHFFNNNTVYLAKLRKLSGKGLLRKATTRWNYWVDALNRIVEEPVFDAIKLLLENANSTFKGEKRKKLPRVITKSDFKKVKEMVAILKPFAQLTDELQGDGVTSSILIPSLVTKLKVLRSTEARFFESLKIKILGGVQARFAHILRNPVYLLATALDPRTKLNVFKLQDTGGLHLPSLAEAKRICSEFLCSPAQNFPERAPATSVDELDFLEAINHEVGQIHKSGDSIIYRSEFEQYLEENLLPSKDDILNFWRLKENQFPFLASAAKLYLAIPASSGSVERLFSELSAIGRSHRASICTSQFEMLVMYTEAESSKDIMDREKNQNSSVLI